MLTEVLIILDVSQTEIAEQTADAISKPQRPMKALKSALKLPIESLMK